jgi:hypothetical protein
MLDGVQQTEEAKQKGVGSMAWQTGMIKALVVNRGDGAGEGFVQLMVAGGEGLRSSNQSRRSCVQHPSGPSL